MITGMIHRFELIARAKPAPISAMSRIEEDCEHGCMEPDGGLRDGVESIITGYRVAAGSSRY